VTPTLEQIDMAKARSAKLRADKRGVKIQLQSFFALFTACRVLGCSDDHMVPTAPMWTIEFEGKRIRVLSYYKSPQGFFITPEDFATIDQYDLILHFNYYVSNDTLDLRVIDPAKLKEKATFVQQGWLPEGAIRPARSDRWVFDPAQVSSDTPLSMS
jgi:hypothetical protein